MLSRYGNAPDAFLLPRRDILMKLVTTALEQSQAKARAGEESEAAAKRLKLRRGPIWVIDTSRSRRQGL